MRIKMIIALVFGSLLSTVYSNSPPADYVYNVSYTCGTLVSGADFDASGAGVTIKTELYVIAEIKCANAVTHHIRLMDPTNIDTLSANIYYTNDGNGTIGTDCFFFQSHNESNMYVVEMNVYWGYSNDSLMHEYEAYTITCSTEGLATNNTVPERTIIDNGIRITADLEGHIGDGYSGLSSLVLVDVLGRPITGNTITMQKKVMLQLSIDGSGGKLGVMPYWCEAYNSDNTQTYRILSAGCGDGIMFPTTVGFTTKGLTATSPHFKVFGLLEALGNTASVSYQCAFSTCTVACDGSSCAIRNKRSIKNKNLFLVRTVKYKLERLRNLLDQTTVDESALVGIDMVVKITATATGVIGGIAVVLLIVTLCRCIKLKRKGNQQLNLEESRTEKMELEKVKA
ncbi:vitelline envelope sperm lysin receptor-like isoform X1 [Mytilus galloprovincialis]|uniref:vitelline envelope sperm lysin receptor-like isoform X1 n=2 Tax=Mytilus galloprovincialis TaxID=29158 RepID=UPI003F7CC01B